MVKHDKQIKLNKKKKTEKWSNHTQIIIPKRVPIRKIGTDTVKKK